MTINMAEVQALFFEESFENLDVMESGLLDLDVGAVNKELVNSIFRAAHSIKGGAGIFKFQQVITFSHTVEALLDEMRNDEHVVTQSIIDLLLRSVDVLRMMLSTLQEGNAQDSNEINACLVELRGILKTQLQEVPIEDGMTTKTVTTTATASETNISSETSDTQQHSSPKLWHITFKPYPHLLQTGNEPINLFRELSNLGELQVTVDVSQVPPLAELDPQVCYLSWQLQLQGDLVTRAEISEIFEWVEGDCELVITSEQEEDSIIETPSIVEETTPSLPLETTETTVSESVIEENIEQSIVVAHTPQESAVVEPIQVEVENPPIQEVILPTPDVVETSPSIVVTPEPTKPAESTPVPTKPVVDKVDKPTPLKRSPKLTKAGGDEAGHGHGSTESSSIRVGIDKIDALINIVGELVITQSMLDQVGEHFDPSRISQLRDGLAQLERNTRELQESVMRIRMLPISYSFNRFPRLVHDLCTQLGKKVELKLSGEHTELDKTVLEKMSDPLVHLVRNALDHGVEMPEQRRAAGKSETGLLHLHAFHQGSNIVIQIRDDGAGIDLDKIREKAIQQRLINRDDSISEEQLQELVFHPGLSTAEQVSDLSGRGVGMDVVRRNIRSLGGTIEIYSKRNQGTTFSIRLPLTLAILDGQLVRVGEHIYILSLLSIIESLRINPKFVNSMAGKAEVYKLRDEYIPILRLYALFGIMPSTTRLDEGLLVIVEGDGQKIGLFVDELLSQQQIVIKNLDTNYRQIQGISGATILGDGSVALILDVAGLVKLFHHHKPKMAYTLPA